MTLADQGVIVVASMPEEQPRDPAGVPGTIGNDWVETEEALISVVRAVLAADGRVTLLGDSTSGIVAGVVAAEYQLPQEAEGPGRPPPRVMCVGMDDAKDLELGQMKELGLIESLEGTQQGWLDENASNAAALVCIGSTSLSDYITIFRKRNQRAPIYAFARSGGDAARLLRSGEYPELSFIDVEVEEFRPPRSESAEDGGREAEFEYPAFAFAAQLMVERLGNQITK